MSSGQGTWVPYLGVFRPWGACPLSTLPWTTPRPPTAKPSVPLAVVPPPPLNPDCLGGRINPLQSPFLFLPSSHACLASKLVSDVKPTGLSQSLSYTHTKTSLSIWDAPTRFPLQTTLLPTGLNVFFRFGPTHPTTLKSVRTLSFSANLSATKPRIPPPTPPSIRQDGQPILVRSLRHCSLIKSPGPDRDYKVVLKDPSAILTHPSPTDSIPRVALPRLTSLHPLTGALSCQSLRSLDTPTLQQTS